MGFGLGVWDLGSRAKGLGLRVWDLGFGALCFGALGFGAWGLGFTWRIWITAGITSDIAYFSHTYTHGQISLHIYI